MPVSLYPTLECSNTNSNVVLDTKIYKPFLCKPGLKLCHLNICSLASKHDQICLLFEETDFHVLSLNETLLDDTFADSELSLNGCNIFRRDRNLSIALPQQILTTGMHA